MLSIDTLFSLYLGPLRSSSSSSSQVLLKSSKIWCCIGLCEKGHEFLPRFVRQIKHSIWWHPKKEDRLKLNIEKVHDTVGRGGGANEKAGVKGVGVATGVTFQAHSLRSSPLSLWYSATYRLLSMLPGMGFMSVPSCSSMPFRLKRSS